MDSGAFFSASSSSMFSSMTKSRHPLQDHSRHTVKRQLRPSQNHGDRFIPNRSSMDFDMARYLLVDARKQKENREVVSPSREAYRKHLAEAAMMNRTQILNFTNQPPTSENRN